MRKWIFVVAVCVCAPIVAWYGWSFYVSKDARKIDRAMVFVTFHAQSTRCDVRTGVSGARNRLPCDEAASYIRDALKAPVALHLRPSTWGTAVRKLRRSIPHWRPRARSVGTIRVSLTVPDPFAGSR